jgi:deoxyribonucleoside regulator
LVNTHSQLTDELGTETLITVAELYYKDGRTQQDIADRLGVSRATVINYLKQTRDKGLVEIKIKGSAYSGSVQAAKLRSKYNLREVYITNTNLKRSTQEAHLSTARLAASALEGLLKSGDKVGVAWGRTIQLVAKEISHTSARDLTICQIIGTVDSDELLSSEASTIRLAENLNGRCYTLHSPAILSTAQLAKTLRKEPVVSNQMKRLTTLDKVLFSLGGIGGRTMIVETKMATAQELDQFCRNGAKAFLCGHILNAKGEHIERSFSERIIGMTPSQIREVPCRICVASYHHEVEALLAALSGNLITHLVIDHSLATLL